MAKQTGRLASLVLYDSSGASANVRGDLNNITLGHSADNPESTTMGETTVTRLTNGLKDYTLTATGVYNSGTASAVDDVLQEYVTGSGNILFKFYPVGIVTGCAFWTACAALAAYETTAPLNGVVGLSFTLQAAAGSLSASTV